MTTIIPNNNYNGTGVTPSELLAESVIELAKGSTIKDAKHEIEKIHPFQNQSAEDVLARAHLSSRPSDLFMQIMADVIEAVKEKPTSGTVSPSLMLSEGIATSTVVSMTEDTHKHNAHLITKAEHEVLFGAGFWLKGKCAQVLREALIELSRKAGASGKKISVRIIYDAGPKGPTRTLAPSKHWTKSGLPSIEEVPNLDMQVLHYHCGILGPFHGKFTIIDRRIACLNSGNVQDMVNLEMCVQYEGRIVDTFYDLFMWLWEKDLTSWIGAPAQLSLEEAFQESSLDNNPYADDLHGDLPPSNVRIPTDARDPPSNRLEEAPGFMRIYRHQPHRPVPIMMVNRSPKGGPGHSDLINPQNAAFMAIFKYAKRNIFIQTPMLNAKPAINGIIDACQRGVKVTAWVCWNYDGAKEKYVPFQGGENTQSIPKLIRKLEKAGVRDNFTVKWYTGKDRTAPVPAEKKDRNCHVKYLSVDDEVVMTGSGNHDTQTWFHSMEVNVLVDSKQLAAEWKQYLENNQNTDMYGYLPSEAK